MYGLGEEMVEMDKKYGQAIRLLAAVAKKKKTVNDVRQWLQKNHPELCKKETSTQTKWENDLRVSLPAGVKKLKKHGKKIVAVLTAKKK